MPPDDGVYCKIPFTHTQYMMTGELGLCCNARYRHDDLRPEVENLGEISRVWKGDYFEKIRADIRAGKKVRYCEECYRNEDLGKESLRQQMNRFLEPLEDDKLGFLEIGFSNMCNLACRMCGPHLSSSWKRFQHAFPSRFDHMLLHNSPRRFSAEFFEDPRNYENLQRLKIMGGEPLLDPECGRFLRTLDEKGLLGRIHLQMYTNCSFFPSDEMVRLLRRARNFDIFMSVDGTGELAGYIRVGKPWEVVRETMVRWLQFRDSNPQAMAKAQISLQCLNAHQFPGVLLALRELGVHERDILFNFVDTPAECDILALPIDYKRLLLKIYANHPLREWEPALARRTLDLALKRLELAPVTPTLTLAKYYGALDQVHGTWMADIIPRLAEAIGLAPARSSSSEAPLNAR